MAEVESSGATVEQLEMFSRKARLGWETWGDEALHGTEAMAV